jgi:hypothetical protein
MSSRLDRLGILSEQTRFSRTVHRFRDLLDSFRIGHFIKMDRFDNPSRDLEKTLCHMERHALISKKSFSR